MMRVALQRNGQTISPGQPEELFDWGFFDHNGRQHRRYDILKDGRFLALLRNATAEVGSPFDLIVIQNWIEELKTRAVAK